MSDLPMQPVWRDNDGVIRFKPNGIVQYLLDFGGIDMNLIAIMHKRDGTFTDEEMSQFAQLIGYSVSGFGDLDYVTDEQYKAAEERAAALQSTPE